MFYLNKKGRSVHVLELRQYSDLSHHIKETQNGIDFLNFFKNDNIWKLRVLRTCFIPEVTWDLYHEAGLAG